MTVLAVGPVYTGDRGHNFDVILERMDDDEDSATFGDVLPYDLSAAGPTGIPTVLQYVFVNPNSVRTTETPTITAATTGELRWTNDAITDFTVPGRWRFQAVLTFAGGEVVHSDIGHFTVELSL